MVEVVKFKDHKAITYRIIAVSGNRNYIVIIRLYDNFYFNYNTIADAIQGQNTLVIPLTKLIKYFTGTALSP